MAQHSHLKELSVNAQTEEPGDHDAEPVTHRECHICSTVQTIKSQEVFMDVLWMFDVSPFNSLFTLFTKSLLFASLCFIHSISYHFPEGKAHEAATLAHHQDTFVVILQLGPVADVWEEAHQKCRTQEAGLHQVCFFCKNS